MKTTRPAESGHWYDRQGNPVYETPSADGKRMVKTTLRHARTLGLVPGITTIIGCAASPGLELWKVKQAIYSALTLPRLPEETDEDYVARVLKDSQEQARQAAARGTEIHAVLEGYFSGELDESDIQALPSEDQLILEGVLDRLRSVCGEQPWLAEQSFAHPIGYGSKADLVCDDWLIDFKGSDFGPEDEMRIYRNHWMQLAATHEGLRKDLNHQRRCCILYFSRNNPGTTAIVAATEDELERGWTMFRALHAFWCVDKNYNPSFED